MTIEAANNLKHGDHVFYANAFYEVAEIKEFPHGIMVGVYDEPKSDHIDYLQPNSVDESIPCYVCHGSRCLVCSGRGRLTQ